MTIRRYEDLELPDGGVIEAPDNDGVIRRRDINGNIEDRLAVEDPEWATFAEHFGVTAADFDQDGSEESDD
jgi:hypothetical protein